VGDLKKVGRKKKKGEEAKREQTKINVSLTKGIPAHLYAGGEQKKKGRGGALSITCFNKGRKKVDVVLGETYKDA